MLVSERILPIIITICLFLSYSSITQAQQDRKELYLDYPVAIIGLKGGGLTHTIIKKEELTGQNKNFKTSINNTGFHFGGTAGPYFILKTSKNIGLQVETNYQNLRHEVDYQAVSHTTIMDTIQQRTISVQADIQASTLEVPLLFSYRLLDKSYEIYTNGGLSASFILSTNKRGTEKIRTVKRHQGQVIDQSITTHKSNKINYSMEDVSIAGKLRIGTLIPVNKNYCRIALGASSDMFSRLPSPSPPILFFSVQAGYQFYLTGDKTTSTF